MAEQRQLTLAEFIYGKEHFDQEHCEQYYKPRYLRRVTSGKVLGYPNGIPGGWDSFRKIHFIGHSQGSQTIRYLQYLLSIDYFAAAGDKKVDKREWVASITCLNPILNGCIPTYMFDWNVDKDKFVSAREGGTLRDVWFTEGCKIFSIVVNLLAPGMTQNARREVIKEVMTSSKGHQNEIVYDLGL